MFNDPVTLHRTVHYKENTMSEMKKTVSSFLQDESGQSMIEYALIAAFISLAAIAFFTPIQNAISNKFSVIASSLK